MQAGRVGRAARQCAHPLAFRGIFHSGWLYASSSKLLLAALMCGWVRGWAGQRKLGGHVNRFLEHLPLEWGARGVIVMLVGTDGRGQGLRRRQGGPAPAPVMPFVFDNLPVCDVPARSCFPPALQTCTRFAPSGVPPTTPACQVGSCSCSGSSSCRPGGEGGTVQAAAGGAASCGGHCTCCRGLISHTCLHCCALHCFARGF